MSAATNTLLSVEDAAAVIAQNEISFIAGSENALARLPNGAWIGGTIPYFMAEDGGVRSDDLVNVTVAPEGFHSATVKLYGETDLATFAADSAAADFSYVVTPSGSSCHTAYAQYASNLPGFFDRPKIGWIAGVGLDQLESHAPKVFDGRTGTAHQDALIAAHVSLQPGLAAEVDIINVFEPGDGDAITVDTVSFAFSSVRINGVERPFRAYIEENGVDMRFPLVGDFAGEHINVSFQRVEDDVVHLYAPLFPGVTYRAARPLPDYAEAFRTQVGEARVTNVYVAVNCILNYAYGELDGVRLDLPGPFTFGEIAYVLLNQTAASLSIVSTQD